MDNEHILDVQREAYRKSFEQHGDTPRGTFQNNRITQNLRFDALVRHISPYFIPGTTVHDIGSGLCDFYGYMQDHGLNQTLVYSGTEIVEAMNTTAAAKYPELKLSNRDFLDPAVQEEYDFLILSGTFNMFWGIDPETWQAMCYALMEKMFLSCRKGISFNVLTSYRTFSDPNLCYFDPKAVFDFATTKLSRFVTQDAGYPLYEVTFTVLRKEFVASLNPDPKLQKYFR